MRGRLPAAWRSSSAARAGDVAEVGEHHASGAYGQCPCLEADYAIGVDAATLLRPGDRGGGPRAVNAVHGEHRVGAGCETAASLVQRGLKLFDHRSMRSVVQCRWLCAVAAERGPGSRPDDAVGSQVAAALELLDSSLGHRAEDAVDLLSLRVRRTRRYCAQRTVGPLAPSEMVAGVVMADSY